MAADLLCRDDTDVKESLGRPVGVDFNEIRAANDHFRKFVENAVRALVEVEEQRVSDGTKSELRFFCRVDVGILRDPQGEYHYFINEVQRSHGAFIFAAAAPDRAENLAKTMANGFLAQVLSRRVGKSLFGLK